MSEAVALSKYNVFSPGVKTLDTDGALKIVNASNPYRLMRIRIILLSVAFTSVFAESQTPRIAEIISRLDSTGCYTGHARVTLTLPQRSDDVMYDVDFMQTATGSDTLAPAAYLTEMSLETPLGPSKSFAAYFDGNFYRSRGPRLQEYHYVTQPDVFCPSKGRGVQFASQFVDLMPRYLADKLRKDLADKSVYMKLASSASEDVLTVLTQYDGTVVREERYVLDPVTSLPRRISIEANPATISEQTIEVNYTFSDTDKCRPIDEQFLMERYPDIFSSGRESDYRLESLVGTNLPSYALRDISGSRILHRSGDPYSSPVIMAFVEAGNSASEDLISEIRRETALLPTEVAVIWAFNGNVTDEAEELLMPLAANEKVLMSVKGFARDCGVTAYPSVVVCDRTGKVAFVRTGYNKDLPAIVMQQMALLD